MPVGRPTEYNPKILKQAKAYLDLCKDEETTKQIGEKEVFRIRVKLPSVEGLSRHLKIHRSTVYEWAKAHPEFSDILEDILAEQAQRLMENGLSGDYNSTISKLILTKHGYSDKQELTGEGGKDLIPQPILGTLNVISTHDGDAQNSEADQTDQGDSGRDISEQDDLDRIAPDSSQPDGPEA